MSFRFYDNGFIFDSASNAAFCEEENFYELLAYSNTKIVNEYAKIINPTIHFKPGDFLKLPYIKNKEKKQYITRLTIENINISKEDWNAFETSWNFRGNRRADDHLAETGRVHQDLSAGFLQPFHGNGISVFNHDLVSPVSQ